MAECTSAKEFEKKFKRNQKISGSGPDTTLHCPCSFCAEPDWMVYRVLETKKALEKGAICKHCGRGARAKFVRGKGYMEFELFQTAGEPPPSFLVAIRWDPKCVN